MTIETLKARIEGKQKEIARLEAKLARIQKAADTNWEVNPYGYFENDLRYTTRDLQDAKYSLAKYEEQLVAEEQKAASRTVPAILEFLEGWKERMTDFYHRQFSLFLQARDEYYRADREFCDWYNNESWKWRREGRKEDIEKMNSEWRQIRQEFNEEWNWIMTYVDRDQFLEEKFQRDIKVEADRKYDFIIERTNAIVGTITDASNLYVGDKGDLNGFIIGTNGTAKVQTIGAGGYNIQCFHFRTLINRMR